MSDAEKIARWIVKDIHIDHSFVEPRIDDESEVIAAIATALLAAEARGYAAAREQAVEAVEEVKRIYVDASNANSAGPLLDEAAAAIRKMEPNT